MREDLTELPSNMCECEAMVLNLGNEFNALMEIVRHELELLKVWRCRNRSIGSCQLHKGGFERRFNATIAERKVTIPPLNAGNLGSM